MAQYLDQEHFQSRISIAEQRKFCYSIPQKQVRAYADLYKDAIKLMNSSD